MYHDIARNKRRSVLLIAIFSLILLSVGWAFGVQTGSPETGIILAALFATIMTLTGYFAGDKVALASAGAKKITKADAPLLWNTLENLSITAGIPMPALYLINDSSANAFATGRNPAKASIAVTNGLLDLLTPAELEGVLAHELSHIGNYDIRIMTLVVVLVGTILLLSDWLLRSFFFRSRDSDQGKNSVLLLVGFALALLSPLFAELIKLAVSRSREYLADASGSLLTRHPEGLASALEKIAHADKPLKRANHATAHLFLANPFDPHVTKKFEQFFSTHPPIEDRIKRLRAMLG